VVQLFKQSVIIKPNNQWCSLNRNNENYPLIHFGPGLVTSVVALHMCYGYPTLGIPKCINA